jgi:hypothetical protein
MRTATTLTSLLLEDEPDFDADEYMSSEPTRISTLQLKDGLRYHDLNSGSYVLVGGSPRWPSLSLAYVDGTTCDASRVRIGLDLLRHAVKKCKYADYVAFQWWTYLVDKYKVAGNIDSDDPASMWNLVDVLVKEHKIEVTGTSGTVMTGRILRTYIE